MKSILEVFHPLLKFLELKNCTEIKLADLAVCAELEGLKILAGCSFNSHEIDVFNPDTFLPKLKGFQSNICMGLLSRLFEEKSGLVNLVLHCSHIGMEVEREEQPRKRFKVSLNEPFFSFDYALIICLLSSVLGKPSV